MRARLPLATIVPLAADLVLWLTISLEQIAAAEFESCAQHTPLPLLRLHGRPMTMHGWNSTQPIYRQLRDLVVAMILDGILDEGDPLPSVRSVSAEYRVNPLTVLKAYQQLTSEQLVEKKRGLGMYVNIGARNLLLQAERQRFLVEEWPGIQATIRRLGLTPGDLQVALAASRAAPKSRKEH